MTFDEAAHVIKRGNLLSLRHALENGLDPNATSKLGVSLLSRAASEGNTSIGRLLIDSGAIIDQRDKWGHTPLATACMRGRSDFVKLFLDRGATLNFDSNVTSVEASLNWVGKYCGVAPVTMRRIRSYFDEAKLKRQMG